MSRKLLIISTVLLVAGLAILIYADPVARLSFGPSSPRRTFLNGNTTRIFTGGNFTVPSGTFTGRGAGGTVETVATLVAVALLGVGLVFEVLTIFLWKADHGGSPSADPAPQAAGPGRV